MYLQLGLEKVFIFTLAARGLNFALKQVKCVLLSKCLALFQQILAILKTHFKIPLLLCDNRKVLSFCK